MLVWKPEVKGQLGRTRHRWKDSIEWVLGLPTGLYPEADGFSAHFPKLYP